MFSINPNALTDELFVEANTMPLTELWGDIDLDLHDDWDLSNSILE
jgi:hypothetical protein